MMQRLLGVILISLVAVNCCYDQAQQGKQHAITLPLILVDEAFGNPDWEVLKDYQLKHVGLDKVSVPDELMVYQFEEEKFDEEYLRKYSKGVMDVSNLKAYYGNKNCILIGSDKDTGTRVVYESISLYYQGEQDGGLVWNGPGYNNPEKYYHPSPKPTNEELSEIARKWLEERDLIPVGINLPEYTVYQDVDEEMGRPETKRVLAYSVDFAPYISGYPIHGNCHRFLVGMLSGDKRVVHLYRRWLKIKEWKKLTTRSIKEAFEALNRGEGEAIDPMYVGAQARFSRIVYYAQDYGFEYLQPAYYFEVDNGESKKEIKVPALRPEYYDGGIGMRMGWK